jgi:hypothetical protein
MKPIKPDDASKPDHEPTYEELKAQWPPPFRGRAKPRPKVVAAEVSPRMHAAVKARPEKLRMIAEDEHGVAVIERPYRPRAETPIPVDNGGRAAVGAMKWGHAPWPNSIPTPRWTGLRGDELVKRNYDIFAVLRENDDD